MSSRSFSYTGLHVGKFIESIWKPTCNTENWERYVLVKSAVSFSHYHILGIKDRLFDH